MNGIDHLLCLGGINGIVAAHRDHHGIQPLQLLGLFGCKQMPQIPQVCHADAIGFQNMHGVGTAMLAAVMIVKNLYRADGKGVFGARQDLNDLGRAMVGVLVAAQHLLGAEGGQAKTGNLVGVIGIQQNCVARVLHSKAGMSIPCDFHILLFPLFAGQPCKRMPRLKISCSYLIIFVVK